ncbi:hypothetical protein HDU67_007223 [Dinochytrium kinnereticum]|nr:hypothetical protein HDU67_007223 [Dinochytrium kinnereticum]
MRNFLKGGDMVPFESTVGLTGEGAAQDDFKENLNLRLVGRRPCSSGNESTPPSLLGLVKTLSDGGKEKAWTPVPAASRKASSKGNADMARVASEVVAEECEPRKSDVSFSSFLGCYAYARGEDGPQERAGEEESCLGIDGGVEPSMVVNAGRPSSRGSSTCVGSQSGSVVEESDTTRESSRLPCPLPEEEAETSRSTGSEETAAAKSVPPVRSEALTRTLESLSRDLELLAKDFERLAKRFSAPEEVIVDEAKEPPQSSVENPVVTVMAESSEIEKIRSQEVLLPTSMSTSPVKVLTGSREHKRWRSHDPLNGPQQDRDVDSIRGDGLWNSGFQVATLEERSESTERRCKPSWHRVQPGSAFMLQAPIRPVLDAASGSKEEDGPRGYEKPTPAASENQSVLPLPAFVGDVIESTDPVAVTDVPSLGRSTRRRVWSRAVSVDASPRSAWGFRPDSRCSRQSDDEGVATQRKEEVDEEKDRGRMGMRGSRRRREASESAAGGPRLFWKREGVYVNTLERSKVNTALGGDGKEKSRKEVSSVDGELIAPTKTIADDPITPRRRRDGSLFRMFGGRSRDSSVTGRRRKKSDDNAVAGEIESFKDSKAGWDELKANNKLEAILPAQPPASERSRYGSVGGRIKYQPSVSSLQSQESVMGLTMSTTGADGFVRHDDDERSSILLPGPRSQIDEPNGRLLVTVNPIREFEHTMNPREEMLTAAATARSGFGASQPLKRMDCEDQPSKQSDGRSGKTGLKIGNPFAWLKSGKRQSKREEDHFNVAEKEVGNRREILSEALILPLETLATDAVSTDAKREARRLRKSKSDRALKEIAPPLPVVPIGLSEKSLAKGPAVNTVKNVKVVAKPHPIITTKLIVRAKSAPDIRDGTMLEDLGAGVGNDAESKTDRRFLRVNLGFSGKQSSALADSDGSEEKRVEVGESKRWQRPAKEWSLLPGAACAGNVKNVAANVDDIPVLEKATISTSFPFLLPPSKRREVKATTTVTLEQVVASPCPSSHEENDKTSFCHSFISGFDGITSFQYCDDMKDEPGFGLGVNRGAIPPASQLLDGACCGSRASFSFEEKDGDLASEFWAIYEDLLNGGLSLDAIIEKHMMV